MHLTLPHPYGVPPFRHLKMPGQELQANLVIAASNVRRTAASANERSWRDHGSEYRVLTPIIDQAEAAAVLCVDGAVAIIILCDG